MQFGAEGAKVGLKKQITETRSSTAATRRVELSIVIKRDNSHNYGNSSEPRVS